MQMIKTCLLLFFLLPLMLFSDPLEKKLSDHIIYNKEGANPIGYLKLSKDNPIQESTYLYVKFAIEEFKKYKVPFVVFDIDSPGGEVFAALKISQELKKLDSQDGIPVVAFIDNWALSAGALMAYSCRFIGITPDASMGAAEPVLMAEQGKMETASEKVNSALRAEFANAARFFGRDPLIAEAMVDKDIILVIRSGQVCRLESETDIITTGKNPDKIISRKGKLLTLDAMQLMNLGVADFEVPYQPLDAATNTGSMIPFSECLLSKQPFFHQIPDAYLIDYQSSKISFFS
ncbi:MAG: serine protease, partial [Chlamydiae bacterium]|nr:serine protease [Chlamydiota bacterium]